MSCISNKLLVPVSLSLEVFIRISVSIESIYNPKSDLLIVLLIIVISYCFMMKNEVSNSMLKKTKGNTF